MLLSVAEINAKKTALRQTIEQEIAFFSRKEVASQAIAEHLFNSAACRSAQTVLTYLSLADEVSTLSFPEQFWKDGKKVLVPYCHKGELGLFPLTSFDQLSHGVWGILEPKKELRSKNPPFSDYVSIDLVITPGLAFDLQGGRLGHGKGYYDKLFHHLPPKVCKVALAFDCQIVPEVPMLPHDVRMDALITASGWQDCVHPFRPAH